LAVNLDNGDAFAVIGFVVELELFNLAGSSGSDGHSLAPFQSLI
jgi:hypothetical protein